MTYRPAPAIEDRSAGDIFEEMSSRLTASPGLAWSRPDPPTEALVRIVARYWEIVTSRINQTLDKKFLAYLDLLGVSPIPPTAATVPLTFTAVPGAPAGSRVPAGTQVAADADEGDAQPVVFETLRSLEVTNSSLRHLFSLDPWNNAQTDLTAVANAVLPHAMPVFANTQPSDHAVFIGDSHVFGLDHVRGLSLRFRIESRAASGAPRHTLRWTIVNGQDNPTAVPVSDGTIGLTQSGDVAFRGLGTWPEQEVWGRRSRWLQAQLVAFGTTGQESSYAEGLELVAEVGRSEVPVAAALADTVEIDLSKDFLPFGLRPVFGSTLYLESGELFSRAGANVTLDIRLTNPHDAVEDPPVPRVHAAGHPRVRWEYWNGRRWEPLTVTDGTKGFRVDGAVSFRIPDDYSIAKVRGVEGAWVRARLVSGDYGEDERWEVPDPGQPAAGMRHRPATLAPPSIQSIAGSYTLQVVKSPEFVITRNERVYDDVSERAASGRPFALFGFPGGAQPAAYLGFAAPRDEDFVSRSLSLYVCAGGPDTPVARSGGASAPVAAVWQFWDGAGWRPLDVLDESRAFTQDGAVTLVVPPEARPRSDFVDGLPSYWLRAVRQDSEREWVASVRGILNNTVIAAQRVTFENEVLGSSRATPSQVFRVLRTPVLEGELLQVREADSASDGGGKAAESGWQAWYAVNDFLQSRPEDRHYVIDRALGHVSFGDGRRGRIPPLGSNNVRLRCYQSGGGAAGNKPAARVNQLRTALPYIESVVNSVAARGGVDAETIDLVRHRGATPLRHRGRAVTAEDYEDLAHLASPEVRRAFCIPLRDLADEPSARRRKPGVVSLIVIPGHAVSKPCPDDALLRHVRAYIDLHRNPATELVVTGPDYVRVGAEMEVVVTAADEAGRVAREIKALLEAFLHPLSGGPRGEGWRLGELPERGDLYGLCASVSGVAYLSQLHVTHAEERPAVLAAGDFLICSGTHEIAVRYERDPRAVSDGIGEASA